MREWFIKYWLQVMFGAIVTGFSVAYKKYVDKKRAEEKCKRDLEEVRLREFELIKQAMQATLRGQIIQAYNHCLDRGNICRIYEKENAEELYKSYHALGGNGVIDGVYKDLLGMETKGREEQDGRNNDLH